MPPLSLNLASPFPKSPPPLPKTWLLLSHSSAAPFPKPCPLKARNSFPDSRREDPFHMAGRIPQWREDLPPPAGRPSGQGGQLTDNWRTTRPFPNPFPDNCPPLSRTHSRTTAPPSRTTPGNSGQLWATSGNSGQLRARFWEKGRMVLGKRMRGSGKWGWRWWERGRQILGRGATLRERGGMRRERVRERGLWEIAQVIELLGTRPSK